MNKVLVAGVGMIPFSKPGASKPYPEMAAEAVRLLDAHPARHLVKDAYRRLTG